MENNDTKDKIEITKEKELETLKQELSDLKIMKEIELMKNEISKFKDESVKKEDVKKESNFTKDAIANKESVEFNAKEYAKSLVSGKEE